MKWLINALTAIGGSDRRVVSIAACVYMSDEEFLWEEVFNWYEEQDSAGIFLDLQATGRVSSNEMVNQRLDRDRR
jgi:hypothetical protein